MGFSMAYNGLATTSLAKKAVDINNHKGKHIAYETDRF